MIAALGGGGAGDAGRRRGGALTSPAGERADMGPLGCASGRPVGLEDIRLRRADKTTDLSPLRGRDT
jgi:hypothetical protein